MAEPTLSTITALSKRRGFIYPTSEIYGGLISSYDYGYYGTLLKKNISDHWWKKFVTSRSDMIGIDSSIILHPKTWVASGHVSNFNDVLVEDIKNNKRYRADHLIEDWIDKKDSRKKEFAELDIEGMSIEQMSEFISEQNIKSPDGNDLSELKKFNGLFETSIGVVESSESKVYLRGETAQGIFSNFKPIIDSMRVKLPFGVGQIGKSFRNEITTGQFTFRTLEFEQMEIEYFFNPNDESVKWQDIFDKWLQDMFDFYQEIGLSKNKMHVREHTDAERSHYSDRTVDIDYEFDFGTKEILGLAYRTDFDLTQHSEFSDKDLLYRDPVTGEKFIPHVIEPAGGLDRAVLATIYSAYTEEKLDSGKTRTVLKFKPKFAPIKVAIFPLQKDDKLVKIAHEIFTDLSQDFTCEFDNAGNIGKMYRRQDEIGTPFCLTVDYDTLESNTVTIRHRDDMSQERVEIADLKSKLTELINA